MKMILAFLLVFSDGQYENGAVYRNQEWVVINDCKEEMKQIQAKFAANGYTTKAGCFEVTIPQEPKNGQEKQG